MQKKREERFMKENLSGGLIILEPGGTLSSGMEHNVSMATG